MISTLVPIVAGLSIGFLIGLTGMGGGALMTPFLIIWLKMDPVLAVGTDLMFAAVTKIAGGIQHRREDNVALKTVGWMAVGSLPAAIVTGRYVLAQQANRTFIDVVLPRTLGIVLIAVGLAVLGRYLLGRKIVIAHKVRSPSPPALIAIGICGGALVGLTSVGGGTVIMAFLLIFYSLPLHSMVGIDVTHGAVLTSTAALTYASGGQTAWSTVALLLVGSLPGVWLGAKSVGRVDARLVRVGVAVLILLAGVDLLID